MSETIRADGRQQRDSVIGARYVEIDARNVGEISAILVSLKKEMAAIIVTFCRATRIMIENQVSVFVRLGAATSAQVAELRDHT